MRTLLLMLFLLALTAAALAQPQPAAPDAVAIDPQLWTELTQAVGQISMPAPAHQQVQAILENVRREAQARAARAKAMEAAKQAKPAQ